MAIVGQTSMRLLPLVALLPRAGGFEALRRLRGEDVVVENVDVGRVKPEARSDASMEMDRQHLCDFPFVIVRCAELDQLDGLSHSKGQIP